MFGGVALGSAPPKDAWAQPRLVVHVSVDQLRADYLTRFYRFLPGGGLKRLLDGGAWFTDAHYGYGVTFTGPGHAVQLTGAYAYRNGIVGNIWYSAKEGKMVAPCDDSSTTLTGVDTERPGASPRSLLATTVGDVLISSTQKRARVVALSLKDRASVFMAGHLGTAAWFDRAVGRFVSSSYYGALPRWVAQLNARDLPGKDFGKTWARRGPKEAYALATADDVEWEEPSHGLGRTFPRKVVGSEGKRDTETYFRAWAISPYAITATLELTKAAISSESLGKDDIPDILAVGISSTDYAGHAYGPHSHELVSMLFDVDAFMRDLFAHLDKTVGKDKYLVSFTSDHGVSGVPGYLESLGLSAGRIPEKVIRTAINDALSARWGAAEYVAGIKLPQVHLDPKMLATQKAGAEEAEIVAAAATASIEGIREVFTRDRLLKGLLPNTRLNKMIQRSFHAERGGSLYVLTHPHWFQGYKGRKTGTAHGTPYRYDTQVPLVLYGAPWFKPGRYTGEVEMVDLAPTLSTVLGLTRPSQSEGRPLSEALRL